MPNPASKNLDSLSALSSGTQKNECGKLQRYFVN